jgi:hypothetical protein
MSVTVKTMKERLACLPEDARLYGYEGEDTGVGVMLDDGSFTWIRARYGTQDDEQPEFLAWLQERER